MTKNKTFLNLLIGIKKVNDRGYISKIVDSIEKLTDDYFAKFEKVLIINFILLLKIKIKSL